MLAKWREGYDVVYGVRENRKESALLRGAYSLFYRILKRIANVDLPLDAGDFSLMDGEWWIGLTNCRNITGSFAV